MTVQKLETVVASSVAIEAEIAQLEKARERLVSELFQDGGRSDRPMRFVLEEIGRNPEIIRIDAALEELQAQQAETFS